MTPLPGRPASASPAGRASRGGRTGGGPAVAERAGEPARSGRRAGRPPGPGNTRQDVLEAARRAFASRGYEAASLRAIAAAAGVDPAMVRHFFGSKAGLFQAAMELPVDIETVVPAVIAQGVDGIGERLVRLFLSIFESPQASPFLTLIRSAVSHEESARMFREFVSEQLLTRIAGAVDRTEPRLRASLVGSQMAGLVMVRYIIRVEPLASADPETVVTAVAPTVQRYLTGDIGLA